MNFLDMNFIYKRENEKLSSIETLFNKINLEYDANNIINKRVYPNALEENICYDENYNIVSIKTANKTLDYKYN